MTDPLQSSLVQDAQERGLVTIWITCNSLNLYPVEVAQIRTIIDNALTRLRGESETAKRHRIRMEVQNREDPKLLWDRWDMVERREKEG